MSYQRWIHGLHSLNRRIDQYGHLGEFVHRIQRSSIISGEIPRHRIRSPSHPRASNAQRFFAKRERESRLLQDGESASEVPRDRREPEVNGSNVRAEGRIVRPSSLPVSNAAPDLKDPRPAEVKADCTFVANLGRPSLPPALTTTVRPRHQIRGSVSGQDAVRLTGHPHLAPVRGFYD